MEILNEKPMHMPKEFEINESNFRTEIDDQMSSVY